MLGPIQGALTNLVVRHVKKIVPAYRLPGTHSLSRALTLGRQAAYTRPELDHTDLALLPYTGGTPGIDKGALLTHGHLVSNLCHAPAWFTPFLRVHGHACI